MGELNLLFIPFEQWQQSTVDSWIPFAHKIEQEFPWIRYYELPTISKLNPVAQFMINEGMRAGIPNPLARERTVTLYVDKTRFRNQLMIGSEATITILLVDREGNIFWRAQGNYSETNHDDFKNFLREYLQAHKISTENYITIGEK